MVMKRKSTDPGKEIGGADLCGRILTGILILSIVSAYILFICIVTK